MANGTVTPAVADRKNGITEYSLAWVCTAGGAVNGTTVPVKAGTIIGCKFIPGTPTPTNLYDVLLKDPDSVDLLGGVGANALSAAATRSVPLVNTSAPVYFEGGNVELDVTNAGTSKAGTVVFWVKDGGP